MIKKEKNRKRQKKSSQNEKKSKQEVIISHPWSSIFHEAKVNVFSCFSHTGGNPIMPKLTCSNKAPPHPPLTTLYLNPATCSTIQYHHLHSLTKSLPHFTGISHWRSQTAVTRRREKELGIHTHSALPSSPYPPSFTVKHTHKQSKKRNFPACAEFRW